jgi:hypothetical protein
VFSYELKLLIDTIRAMVEDGAMKPVYLSEGIGYVVTTSCVGECDTLRTRWTAECDYLKEHVEKNPVSSNWFADYLFSVPLFNGAENSGPFSIENRQELNSPTPGSCKRFNRFIHAAQLMIAVGAVTASVTKIIYFNTLYAYLRAMDIFITMQDNDECECPSSDDEDGSDNDNESQISELTEFEGTGKLCIEHLRTCS